MKKLVSVLLCVALLASACLALAEDASIVVTDMTGREVKLPAAAQKVVAVTASNAEILYAIGAGDTVIGRGEYCTYPAEVNEVPSVKSGYELNVEEILALEPDLVIMDLMGQTVEQVNALTDAGVPVVLTAENGIEGVYTAIELIGSVTGKDVEAAAVIDEMKAGFAAVAEEAAGIDLSVYFEVSSLAWGDPWTAGADTFMDEIAQMLGMKNCFADLSGWASVSVEEIISRNPDLIVTTDSYWGEGPTPVEEIMGRDGWDVVTAIKNGAVYNADYNEMTIPGPRLVDGARNLLNYVKELQAQQPAA